MRYIMKAVFLCPDESVEGIYHFTAESEEEMKLWLEANMNLISIYCLGPDYISPHTVNYFKKLCEKKKGESV